MDFVYVVATVNPLSSIAAAVHRTRGTWLAYQAVLPLFTLAASFFNLVVLFGFIKIVSKSVILSFLAIIAAFVPLWSPYVIEASLRKHLRSVECDGFDGAVLLGAVNYNKVGLSVAQFPSSLGGQKYSLYHSSDGVFEFAPVHGASQVTLNFINETYSLHTNKTSQQGNITGDGEPLEFPEFGLHSDGDWIRSCFAPAVDLRNATGAEIVKTGLTAYTDCSKQTVCVRKSSGMDVIIVAIARILIALEAGASCCTRPRWH
jgi:hypothetical protein